MNERLIECVILLLWPECFLRFCLAVEMYVTEVSRGLCDSKATPVIIKETPGTAFVDGRNGIGSVRVCVAVWLLTLVSW